MNSQISFALFAALLLVGLGCQNPSHVEKHWGEAYRAAVARQTAEPEAAAINADEPAPQGLDGQTAEDVMTGYHENQAPEAEQPNPYSVIMGGGSQ